MILGHTRLAFRGLWALAFVLVLTFEHQSLGLGPGLARQGLGLGLGLACQGLGLGLGLELLSLESKPAIERNVC